MGIKDILESNDVPVPESLQNAKAEPPNSSQIPSLDQEPNASKGSKSTAVAPTSGLMAPVSNSQSSQASIIHGVTPIQIADDGVKDLKQLLANFVSVQDLNFLIDYAKKQFGDQGMAKAKIWGIGIKALTKALSSVKSRDDDGQQELESRTGFPADYYVC